MTQPAAAPHDEKSTININSFFQWGIADFKVVLSRCVEISKVLRRPLHGAHLPCTAPEVPTASANICSDSNYKSRIHATRYADLLFNSRALVKVVQHMWLTYRHSSLGLETKNSYSIVIYMTKLIRKYIKGYY